MRHLVASRALALVLLAVVALTIAILAGSLGNAGLLATRTAQAAFTNPDSGDAGLQFQTRLADDGGQQDDLLRQALADAFSPVAVTTWTTVLSEPVRLDGGRVVLYSGERYSPEFLELVEGAWPSGPGEAALQADAAARLGLVSGSEVPVGDRAVTVSALWRAKDPAAPLWLGDPLVTAGTDGSSSGSLVVDRSIVEATSSPFIQWVALPEVASITPQQLRGLAERAGTAAQAAEVADLTGRGLLVTGDLGPTAEQAARQSASGDAFGVVPVSVLVLIADEPTGQLDSDTAATIMDLIVELTHERGLASVVSTHDPLLIARADRVVRLLDGAVSEPS